MREWLEDRTPPPGGPARLRARLDAEEAREARRHRGGAIALGAVAVAAALLLALWPTRPPEAPALPSEPGLVALGLAAPSAAPVTGADRVALRPVAEAPGVIVYQAVVLP